MLDHVPVGNKIDLLITGLTTAADTDTPITDATITFSVYGGDSVSAAEVSESDVIAGMDAVSMPHVSVGTYRGGSTPTTDLTPGNLYRVVVSSSNYNFRWDETFYARARAFNL